MDLMTIVMIIAADIIVFFLFGGIFAYFRFAVPAMKTAPPMTESDREVCRVLIRQYKAYPFLCRASVRKGACPCQPCRKLNDAKAAKSQR